MQMIQKNQKYWLSKIERNIHFKDSSFTSEISEMASSF